MLSKEELLEKEVSELEAIAQSTGAVYSPGDDKDKLVYAILDRQAEEAGTAHPLESKRKRTRIARKDTDRVYSVHGEEGENFDVQKNKNTATSQPSLFKELPETKGDKTEEKSPEEILASIPKHRGRKSKAELEAIAAAEAAIKAKAEEPQQTKEPVEEAPIENVEPSASEDFIPEDQFVFLSVAALVTKLDDGSYSVVVQAARKLFKPDDYLDVIDTYISKGVLWHKTSRKRDQQLCHAAYAFALRNIDAVDQLDPVHVTADQASSILESWKN